MLFFFSLFFSPRCLIIIVVIAVIVRGYSSTFILNSCSFRYNEVLQIVVYICDCRLIVCECEAGTSHIKFRQAKVKYLFYGLLDFNDYYYYVSVCAHAVHERESIYIFRFSLCNSSGADAAMTSHHSAFWINKLLISNDSQCLPRQQCEQRKCCDRASHTRARHNIIGSTKIHHKKKRSRCHFVQRLHQQLPSYILAGEHSLKTRAHKWIAKNLKWSRLRRTFITPTNGNNNNNNGKCDVRRRIYMRCRKIKALRECEKHTLHLRLSK